MGRRATSRAVRGVTKSTGSVKVRQVENRNVNALTLLKCYNITTEQHWDLITNNKNNNKDFSLKR